MGASPTTWGVFLEWSPPRWEGFGEKDNIPKPLPKPALRNQLSPSHPSKPPPRSPTGGNHFEGVERFNLTTEGVEFQTKSFAKGKVAPFRLVLRASFPWRRGNPSFTKRKDSISFEVAPLKKTLRGEGTTSPRRFMGVF
ncbi:hypothetical protein RRG08_066278 [Elysia crispata]|uniref:Uncharacterized protein n=1 Tax=Elysia crispata TaxID=231223 RepID=A0AAE1B8M4_9GAST|nr:hypothetical protein RRG08_066278 [Elysia crispata]